MISILHPSRSRPDQSYRTLSDWWRKAGSSDFETIISIDVDDPHKQEYKNLYPTTYIENRNRSAVDAINNAAKMAKGDIMIVVSDDTECPDNWLPSLLNCIKRRTDFIMKTQDGIQPWIITMPVLDREYYNRFGYIYHPEYRHMFCDTELTCVADITGRKIEGRITFPHRHYSVTKQTPDNVAQRNDRTWAQGERLFLERYARNFDLPPGGKIQDNGMINWLKNKHARV